MIRHDAHVDAWRAHRQSTRVPVDFSVVPEHQLRMHARLENWARYCHGRRGGGTTAPMFRGYQSPPRVREQRDIPVQIDRLDAERVQALVGRLPLMHARSVQWYYVEGGSPAKAAKRIGFILAEGAAATRAGLHRLAQSVIEARDLIART